MQFGGAQYADSGKVETFEEEKKIAFTPEVVERPFNENASRSRDSSRARTVVADENEETIMVAVDQTEEEWSPDSLPSIASTTSVDPEWVRCNLDTGASLTVFPKKMFNVGEEETMKLKTASGEVINAYGNAVLRGEDTKGAMRKLNGQVADVQCSQDARQGLREMAGNWWRGDYSLFASGQQGYE